MFMMWALGIGIKKTRLDINCTDNSRVFSIRNTCSVSDV